MSYQTMNLHGITAITVSKQEENTRSDDTIYYVQTFTFTHADGTTMQVSTFSDAPGVLKLASE